MTVEGRKATHERCISQGKPSPYAEEFAEVKKEVKKEKK